MKCENILLDSANNIKVSDFGFARYYDHGDISRTFCGSAAYAAPEILQGMPYHIPMHDIWSMGVILYIMVRIDRTTTFKSFYAFSLYTKFIYFSHAEQKQTWKFCFTS